MRKSYKELVKEVNYLKQRNYLLKVCQDEGLRYILTQCLTKKDFNKLLKHPKIKKELYTFCIDALHQSQDYRSLEYHLIYMNSLFSYQSFTELKMNMYHKLTRRTITLDEYLVIRCLLNIQSLELFVNVLHEQYHVSLLECAKICLIEDEYHLAYLYLKQMDECKDETILDLLCSYSVKDYLSLMNHYRKKQKEILWEKECFTY